MACNLHNARMPAFIIVCMCASSRLVENGLTCEGFRVISSTCELTSVCEESPVEVDGEGGIGLAASRLPPSNCSPSVTVSTWDQSHHDMKDHEQNITSYE